MPEEAVVLNYPYPIIVIHALIMVLVQLRQWRHSLSVPAPTRMMVVSKLSFRQPRIHLGRCQWLLVDPFLVPPTIVAHKHSVRRRL
jgi:hypothetical protein